NTIADHAMDPVFVILQLEPEKLARLASVPTPRDTRVSPLLTKESTSQIRNGSDHGMIGDAGNGNPGSVFVQGASHVVNGNAELTLVGSERVSSGPKDVVIALSVGEKGDGSLPSSVANEEVAATPFEV
ncbi:hypothetical protein Tco_0553819, partial [Tanacetum coccineum]